MYRRNCHGFQVVSKLAFYPFDFQLKDIDSPERRRQLKTEFGDVIDTSYMIYMHHYLTPELLSLATEGLGFTYISKKNCPNVIKNNKWSILYNYSLPFESK